MTVTKASLLEYGHVRVLVELSLDVPTSIAMIDVGWNDPNWTIQTCVLRDKAALARVRKVSTLANLT